MIFLYKSRQAKGPLVMKFGGTSLMTSAHFAFAADLVAQERLNGQPVVVVVSAMAGVTDRLLAQTAEMKAPSGLGRAEIDAVLASGEQASAGLLALALMARNLKSRSFNGPQAGIRTDGRFGEARITKIDCRPLQKALAKGEVPVVTGFQGVDDEGRLTTLGRGGSDLTAVALAAALDATACDIYTDVDGVYAEDPLRNPEARRYAFVSYDEMQQLAESGAKVLQATSVAVARRFQVPLRVRSTFSPSTGTTVGPRGARVASAAIQTQEGVL